MSDLNSRLSDLNSREILCEEKQLNFVREQERNEQESAALIKTFKEKTLKLKERENHFEKRMFKLNKIQSQVNSKFNKLDDHYTKFLNHIDVSNAII